MHIFLFYSTFAQINAAFVGKRHKKLLQTPFKMEVYITYPQTKNYNADLKLNIQ